MENPYNTVPYPGWPRLETHPDRLAAVAILFGMKPPAVNRCRVLEVGCGDGGNLLPMAYALPGSEFTGVDLARAPVAAARRAARALGLRNARVLRADLADLPAALGEFDYIIAHGVYSWTPPETRDALLRLCRQRLTASGVAFISYNALPGRRMRQALREMLLFHTGGRAAVDDARSLLEFVRESATVPAPWSAALRDEIDCMLSRETASLFHDDLAAVNDPVYFHEFAAHAEQHGLRYLGDAQVHEMVDHRGLLGPVRDRVAREQYLDFLKLRRFRQTLLCREEARLTRAPSARRLDRLAFSSPARPEGDFLEGANEVRIRRGDPAVEAVASVLAEAWPRPATFAELGGAHLGAREILFSFVLAGFAEPHAWTFPATLHPGPRPRASALARYQARDSEFVTNLCHRSVQLDRPAARLLALLDGTLEREELARRWAVSRKARQGLGGMLEWMARMALLEA